MSFNLFNPLKKQSYENQQRSSFFESPATKRAPNFFISFIHSFNMKLILTAVFQAQGFRGNKTSFCFAELTSQREKGRQQAHKQIIVYIVRCNEKIKRGTGEQWKQKNQLASSYGSPGERCKLVGKKQIQHLLMDLMSSLRKREIEGYSSIFA